MCRAIPFPDIEVVVEFEVPSYTVVENERMVEVCVRVASGILQRNITVTLSSFDGQAICKSSVANMETIFIFLLFTLRLNIT